MGKSLVELCIVQQQNKEIMNSTGNLNSKSPSNLQQIEKKCKKQCRICLSNDETTDNLLISPCRCSGSIRYVHQLCLKEWMQVRIGEIKNSAISCELCKSSIKVDINLMSRCKTYGETCKAVKEDLFIFVASIGVLFTALWVFGFAFAHLILIMTNSVQLGSAEKVLVFVSLPLGFSIALVVLYKMSRFFISKEAKVEFSSFVASK